MAQSVTLQWGEKKSRNTSMAWLVITQGGDIVGSFMRPMNDNNEFDSERR